jgi:hypothetical protein
MLDDFKGIDFVIVEDNQINASSEFCQIDRFGAVHGLLQCVSCPTLL